MSSPEDQAQDESDLAILLYNAWGKNHFFRFDKIAREVKTKKKIMQKPQSFHAKEKSARIRPRTEFAPTLYSCYRKSPPCGH